MIYSGRNRLGSVRFSSGLFRKFIGSVRFGSVRFGLENIISRFDAVQLFRMRRGSVRFGPVRFGSVSVRPVLFGFLFLVVIINTIHLLLLLTLLYTVMN